MRHPLLLLAAAAVITSRPAFTAEHDWKVGRVMDSRVAKSSTPVGAITNTTGTTTGTATATTLGNLTTATGTAYSHSSSATQIMFANIRDNELVILSSEFGYVVEDTRITGGSSTAEAVGHAIANRRHGCHFIVGDDIRFWQEKAVLHVFDADRKECKVDILRQERLAPNVKSTSIWKSVVGTEHFQVSRDGDLIYAESFGSGERGTAGLVGKIEARKSGNLYVGKLRVAGRSYYRLKSITCALEQEIEFNLVTPTRIEGTILAPLPGAKFDWRTCQYFEPNQIQKFAWIPE